jgi:hypothetical protein
VLKRRSCCQLVAGSVFQGGTAVRFAVRVANWSAPTDALDGNVLRLPFGKPPLIHWAAGSADPVASPNGTCADAVQFHGARHRYCYVPHQRSRAERGSGERSHGARWRCGALRDDEGRFSAQPESLFAVVWRKLNDTAFRFRMSAATTGLCVGRLAQGRRARRLAQAERHDGRLDRRARRAARARHLVRQSAAAGVGRRAEYVVLVSGSSKGGVLTIEFDRLIATGDGANDVDLRDGDVLLQWATFPKAPTVADAATCDDKQFCYAKHANMQQVGSGVVNFFRVGSIAAPPPGALDEVTAADWLAIFVLIFIAIVIVARVINKCLCNRGHKGAPATGGIGMSSMRESTRGFQRRRGRRKG